MLPLLYLVLGASGPSEAMRPPPRLPRPVLEAPFRFDLGLSFSHFQQQAKIGTGGARGERLVEQTALVVHAVATYEVWEYLSLGLFSEFDVGTRHAGAFVGFDEDGAAVSMGELGGTYVEWWLGPIVRGHYRAVFLELGWGALGIRSDGGRADLPDASGETDSSFATAPAIAWLLAIGGSVPLAKRVDLVLRLQYRIRYYTTRGGNSLLDDAVLGSQDITPIVSVRFRH